MKLRYLKQAALAVASLTLFASTGSGATITGLDDIQYWVGTGANSAGLVIDWHDGQTINTYAWGYHWNGTATGEDMFRAIAGFIGSNLTPAAADGTGDPALTLYTQTFSFGVAVYEVDYLSHSEGGFDADSSGYWSYYVADGSSAYPSTWTSSMVGFSDRTLANDSWDGWSWAANFVDVPPSAAVAAIPEPASFALIAIGGGLLVLRTRRRWHA